MLNIYKNEQVDNLPNIKKLVIYNSFNQNIDNLPASLEVLEIRSDFHKTINHLPSSLKVLVLYGLGKIEIKYFYR